jgi:3',5'-cyclic AMP phosphodiesterase CpdA
MTPKSACRSHLGWVWRAPLMGTDYALGGRCSRLAIPVLDLWMLVRFTRTRLAFLAGGLALLGLGPVARPAAAQATAAPYSFVVIGHLRGGSDTTLYSRLDELLTEVKALKPDLVFLTGDLIWGSVEDSLADPAVIEAQWDRLDQKLATLGVPIYRVPGNHDIHDPVTRDIYYRRYGQLPRVERFRGSRFFLLNTTFTPTDDRPVPVKLTKTVRLDSAQVAFVREELAREPAAHDFLFMHHVLWFYDQDPWWQEVHPLLRERGVNAVFTGDLGPAMYTHLVRDSIEYFRNTLNAIVDRPVSADAPQGLVRTLQFENFLHVRVDGPTVRYAVKTVGATTSQAFAPSRWHDVFGATPDPGRYYDPASYATTRKAGPEPGLWTRIRRAATPKRLVLGGGALGAGFLLGLMVGSRRGRGAGRPA